MIPPEITAPELLELRTSAQALRLIDVMTEECFAAAHIPGAEQACVFEMTFFERVASLVPNREAPVVVYGTSARSLASHVAAEKLLAVGYTDVRDFRGGLEAWRCAGGPIEGATGGEVPSVDGTFALDLEKSMVRWTGRNLLNHHEGTLSFSSGEIVVRAGTFARAEFAADLRSLVCTDLADASLSALLIRHLLDADFFDGARWPEARFVTSSAEQLPNTTAGSPNFTLAGQLTLRGQTHPIAFDAVIGTLDGETIAGQAELDLDRTRWGAIYGSGKFFEALGKHVVNDLVHLHIKIIAKRLAAP